jgi:hypothetical protein
MTELDPLVHGPERPRNMAMLSTAEQVEFAHLRDPTASLHRIRPSR